VSLINNNNMKMKKTILYFTSSLMLLYILPSCKPKHPAATAVTLTGTWTEAADFGGVTRSNAVTFTINNRGYLGTGFSGTARLNDFWSYDGTTWTQLTSMPGVPREKAIGFSTDTAGYVGTGYDGVNLLNDFYLYSPSSNTWTRKADFAGNARSGAVSFAIDSIGYVGTGFDGNYKNDFYKYLPRTNQWLPIATLNKKTSSAVSFVINGYGYVCSGIDNILYVNDVSEYNPVNNTWAAKAPLYADINGDGTYDYDLRRSNSTAFVLNGLAYISCGNNNSNIVTSSTYSFNPGTPGTVFNPNTPSTTNGGTWTHVNDMPGGARMDAVAFVINNKAYLGTGRNNNARYDDMWQFQP
jgi:N-acetylneuraminic acid mutarotase